MSESPCVNRSVVIHATPDDVWNALADPGLLSSWFGGEARLAVRPGGTGRFVTDDGEVRLAVVEEVDAGRRIVFSWWPMQRCAPRPGATHPRSRVTIAIEPDRDATVVTVEERVTSPSVSGSPGGPVLRIQRAPSGPRRGWQASARRPAAVA